jgi:hypothetical protein
LTDITINATGVTFLNLIAEELTSIKKPVSNSIIVTTVSFNQTLMDIILGISFIPQWSQRPPNLKV